MAKPHIVSELMQRLVAKIDRDPGLPVDNPTVPFWQEPNLPFAHQQSANLAREADVVVIGSGITGISTALHLSRNSPSLKIVILEARALTSGATGRNGGHIKAVPWRDYPSLKRSLGKESAIKIEKFRLAHLPVLLHEAAALGRTGEAGEVRQVETLIAYYDRAGWLEDKSRLKEFLSDVPEEQGQWIVHEDEADLKSLGLLNACGCISGRAGAAWPYRFLGALTAKLLESGRVTLETHTPALAINQQQSSTHPYQVQTPRGTIQTKHIVHCSNAFAPHLIPGLRGKLFPMRGQMTRQAVSGAFPKLGSSRSWSTVWAKGFDYITQSPGEDASLLLGGGAVQEGLEKDEDIGNTDDSQLSSQCLRHLDSVPAKAFINGEGCQIMEKWTGVMGLTGDGLPIVGRLPQTLSGRHDAATGKEGGEWIAAGFNGYGMVHSWLSGKALAAMIVGTDGKSLDWFPLEEFGCSEKRLDGMSPIATLSHFAGVRLDESNGQICPEGSN